MASYYKLQTYRMIDIYRETRAANVLTDFFSQLARVRGLDTVAFVNAIADKDVDADSSKIIQTCMTQKAWMTTISIEDIRNHVVFTIWKEHETIVDESNYYDKNVQNSLYHGCYYPNSSVNIYTEQLGTVLETAFYVQQISILNELVEDDFDNFSVIEEPFWEMYHLWLFNALTTNDLKYVVYENFKLIQPLIEGCT